MKILLIEDEEELRNTVREYLTREKFIVECAEDYASAMEKVNDYDYDCILLDIMLPDLDGNAILKRLKAEEDTAVLPVIMLSAKSTEIDKVTSLENGADDYITKPFGIMELLSRVKAVLRRSGGKTAQKQGQLSCQGLLLDLDRRTASYESTEIVLTYKEFELLAYLMRNRGTAVSRDRLLEEVWGFQYEGETRTVDAHIKTLRQKLEAAECRNLIGTVRGYGYKIGG